MGTGLVHSQEYASPKGSYSLILINQNERRWRHKPPVMGTGGIVKTLRNLGKFPGNYF